MRFAIFDFCLLSRQLNVTDYEDEDDACYSKRALMAALTYEGSFKGPEIRKKENKTFCLLDKS